MDIADSGLKQASLVFLASCPCFEGFLTLFSRGSGDVHMHEYKGGQSVRELGAAAQLDISSFLRHAHDVFMKAS